MILPIPTEILDRVVNALTERERAELARWLDGDRSATGELVEWLIPSDRHGDY